MTTLADELRSRRSALEAAYLDRLRADLTRKALLARSVSGLIAIEAERLVVEGDVRHAFDLVLEALS